jgi:hypothetical protein
MKVIVERRTKFVGKLMVNHISVLVNGGIEVTMIQLGNVYKLAHLMWILLTVLIFVQVHNINVPQTHALTPLATRRMNTEVVSRNLESPERLVDNVRRLKMKVIVERRTKFVGKLMVNHISVLVNGGIEVTMIQLGNVYKLAHLTWILLTVLIFVQISRDSWKNPTVF